jgi:NAD(P)H-flavin reductase
MATQRDRLVAALGAVVSGVDDLGSVVPVLQGLGRDHRKFDVRPEHYPAVGASLLATLEHFLGPDWTPEVAGSWTEAYTVVAKVMNDAAEEAAHTMPAWWDAEIVAHEVLGGRRDIARVTIATRQAYHYAAGQSFTLETAVAPARWRFFTPAHPTAPGSDLLLIGANTGIAPLRAVVEDLTRTPDHGRRVTVFYGARIAADLYDLPRLQQLAERNPWLTVVPVVSDELSWTGELGLVGDAAAVRGPWAGHEVFVVGSGPMCEHTTARLKEAGVVPGAIHLEEAQA